MLKSVTFMICIYMCLGQVSLSYAQNTSQVATAEFPIPQLGNLSGEPLNPKDGSALYEMSQSAQNFLLSKIRNYLQNKELLSGLYQIYVQKHQIITFATPAVNEAVKDYLQTKLAQELSPALYTQVTFVKMTAEDLQMLSSLTKNFTLNETPQMSIWHTDIAAAHTFLKKVKAQVSETPIISLSNGFLNKLVMTAKKQVGYIKSYRAYTLPDQSELMVPEMGELTKALHIWLFPNIATAESLGTLQMLLETADYKEPVTTIQTPAGPVHHPESHYQSIMTHVRLSFPSVLAILATPAKNQQNYLLLIKLAKNEQELGGK